MTAALAFSKDRPAQLDLLLRSIRKNARWIGPLTVLYTYSAAHYADGYAICRAEHPDVSFIPESDFRAQVRSLVPTAGHFMFLCDDDVFYRRVERPTPAQMLNGNSRLLCWSLRLGANTTECYSLRRSQAVPPDLNGFHWREQEGDFSYVGSLDGHVFRSQQLHWMLSDHGVPWSNPNELEDALHRATRVAQLPLMGCYDLSVLTGVPVNMTNTTHTTNRHSETHQAPLATLNRHYLRGGRLDLASIVPSAVNAAHCEFRMVWEPREAAA